MEKAIGKITGKESRINGAGRTDAGVHARGQVAAFETESALSPIQFEKALNFYLDDDIAIRDACQTEVDFDPRRDAKSREYRYTILNSPARSPLNNNYSYHVTGKLNIDKMNEAAKLLQGEHDFVPFTNQEGSTKNTIRNVYSTKIQKEGEFVWFEIVANAFLPQQVRRIAASLIKVGREDMELTEFHQIVTSVKPGAAREVAPAHGLCLMKVNYSKIGFRYENL